MKTDLRVGQTVYLMPIGEQLRYTSDVVATSIVDIGYKYVYVAGPNSYRHRFHIDTLKHEYDYSPRWKIFFSLEEIEQHREYRRLQQHLLTFFDRWGTNIRNLTLDQLKRIEAIIEEKK